MDEAEEILRQARTVLLIDWPSRDVPDSLVREGFTVFVKSGPEPDHYNAQELHDEQVVPRRTGRPEHADVVYAHRPLGELPGIVADKRALLQIMLNLLSNAVKFTNRGGKVTVTAAAEFGHDSGRESGHATGNEVAHLVVTVADTGVGIGAEDLPRVGEPFFQARSSYDRRHDGTGLGVSIVKGLLDLHGGWMEIESRVSEGTRVIIHLPFDCDGGRRKGEAPARIVPRINDVRPDVRPDILVKKSA